MKLGYKISLGIVALRIGAEALGENDTLNVVQNYLTLMAIASFFQALITKDVKKVAIEKHIVLYRNCLCCGKAIEGGMYCSDSCGRKDRDLQKVLQSGD